LVLDKRCGDGFIAIYCDGGRVNTTGEIPTPCVEEPAGISCRSEYNDVVVMVRCFYRVFRDGSIAYLVDGECVFVLGEGRGNGSVCIHGDGGGIGRTGKIAAPSGERPACVRYCGEGDDGVIGIRQLIRVLCHGSIPDMVRCKGILVLGECCSDGFVPIYRDGGGVDRAGEIAAPVAEAPAKVCGRCYGDDVAVVIVCLVWVLCYDSITSH